MIYDAGQVLILAQNKKWHVLITLKLYQIILQDGFSFPSQHHMAPAFSAGSVVHSLTILCPIWHLHAEQGARLGEESVSDALLNLPLSQALRMSFSLLDSGSGQSDEVIL
jgi:hypothetical protein